jgi:hypothetical protein
MAAVVRRQYKGAAAQTTIVNALAPSDTTATLAATTGWPTGSEPFFVVISPGTASEEKCSATISSSTLTLTRAADDTTAQSHSAGATVYPVFTADDADEANKLASTLTTRGDLLTMDSGPDFKRLALGASNAVLKSDGSDVGWGLVANANVDASAGIALSKLASSTSSQLAAIISDETGSGALVFGTGPAITPAAGTTGNAHDAAGYMGMPQVVVSTGGRTIQATDAGKHIYVTTNNSQAIAIPANGTLALPVGTTIVIVVADGVTGTTVTITTDTLRLANSASTGTRNIAGNGMATLLKIGSTEWIISGNGVT